jgi:2-C-methyl-D-erythritol 4-phosphate cytidylyltransferase/2-C-methyl-D-erythritol 4-phosphate cytidylyltransferase/2-C-methyl-D-erythritol 2,4-cyclodiphosphate synthase
MEGQEKKEYRVLPSSKTGLTVLGAAVRSFAVLSEIKLIIVAVPNDPVTGEKAARNAIPAELLAGKKYPPVYFVKGGKNRRASVYNALAVLHGKFPVKAGFKNYVLIHDGARPWVSPRFIRRIISEVKNHPAVVPVVPLTETPKETTLPMGVSFGKDAVPVYVKTHLKRSCVGISQTPQAFAYPQILNLHKMAAEHERLMGVEFTDDAEIWGTFHGSVAVIPGEAKNRKITFPGDIR